MHAVYNRFYNSHSNKHLSNKAKINTTSQSKTTHPFFRQEAPKGSPEALDGMEPLLKFNSHSDYQKDSTPHFFPTY